MPSIRSAEGVAVIAEVKRSQPQQGRPRRHPRPGRARARPTPPAAPSAISVLTEERRFGGSLADLDAVRAAVRRPGAAQGLHRHAYQVLEARAARRRPGPADRRRPRRRPAARPARPGPRARHDRAGRGARRGRDSTRAVALGARAGRRQRPQPQDPRGRPRHLRPTSRRCIPDGRRQGRRVRHQRPRRRGRATSAPAPARCWSARRWSQDGDPEAAVRGHDRSDRSSHVGSADE